MNSKHFKLLSFVNKIQQNHLKMPKAQKSDHSFMLYTSELHKTVSSHSFKVCVYSLDATAYPLGVYNWLQEKYAHYAKEIFLFIQIYACLLYTSRCV